MRIPCLARGSEAKRQQDEKTYSADAKFVSGSSSAQKDLEAQIWKIGATWQTLVTHVNVCAQIGSGQPGK